MEKNIVIKSTVGLHASLASKLVQTASKYEADVKMFYGDKVVDAKSILGLMSLAVPSGKDIVLKAEGKDAEKAIKEIQKILG
jgi:phosphocarrier protein